jgi:hypothetical protein
LVEQARSASVLAKRHVVDLMYKSIPTRHSALSTADFDCDQLVGDFSELRSYPVLAVTTLAPRCKMLPCGTRGQRHRVGLALFHPVVGECRTEDVSSANLTRSE